MHPGGSVAQELGPTKSPAFPSAYARHPSSSRGLLPIGQLIAPKFESAYSTQTKFKKRSPKFSLKSGEAISLTLSPLPYILLIFFSDCS